ncbi:hypothetical protein [Photobacterium phosphoreum]|uniref:hypothetical protein n=1 Tax=Photobacterium phosphoreum TaxID=659 RepID=UPI0024B6871A|nr:hypothetical protein [Photobacterium phosphoreum]
MTPQQWRQESGPIADDIAQGLPYPDAVRCIRALSYNEQEAHDGVPAVIAEMVARRESR